MGTVTGGTLSVPDGTRRPIDVNTELEGILTGGCDGGIVDLSYEYGPDLLLPQRRIGLWRYEALLPDLGPPNFPTLVGGTPLVPCSSLVPGANTGLLLKDETRGQTLSNKDRASALLCQRALQIGAEKVVAASTGNVAASIAVNAALAGLRARIYVPSDVDQGKLNLVKAVGAEIVLVEAGYDDAFAICREAARANGWVDRNTGVNPLTVEAKKTVAFEIWEQLGNSFPDNVIAPLGDGVTLHALYKGFAELIACGAEGEMPRIFGVQSVQCDPIARAWQSGSPVVAQTPQTLADGVAVGNPVCGALAIEDVRSSGGRIMEVDDRVILETVATMSRHGLLAEPAGAVSASVVGALLEDGLIQEAERTVALLTGSQIKTPRFVPDNARTVRIADADDDCGLVAELPADAAALKLGS